MPSSKRTRPGETAIPFDYADAATRLIADIVARVPALQHIDPERILVFASASKTPLSTLVACHCLQHSEAVENHGELILRDRGAVFRVPVVTVKSIRKHYMIRVAIPLLCNVQLGRAVAAARPESLAMKLGLLVQALHAIGVGGEGFRFRPPHGGFTWAWNRPVLSDEAIALQEAYLSTNPPEDRYTFLSQSFDELVAKHGRVVATVFTTTPHYPRAQRINWSVSDRTGTRQWDFTEKDLVVRTFPIDRFADAAERRRSRYFKDQPPPTRAQPCSACAPLVAQQEARHEGEVRFWMDETESLEGELWRAIELLRAEPSPAPGRSHSPSARAPTA